MDEQSNRVISAPFIVCHDADQDAAISRRLAEAAANAAEHHGVSLSAWINAAAGRALVLEAGLAAVREWEAEHGELAVEELS